MKTIKLVLAVLMLMTIGGCSMKDANELNKEKPTREEVKQKMLDFIDKKYNQEFECYDISYADWGNPGVEEMDVYPKGKEVKHREDTFLVRRFMYKGKVKITDGYVGYLNYPKYKKLSESIIKKYFPEAIGEMPVYFNYLYPHTLTPKSTFEEFKKYTDSVFRISHTIYIGFNGGELNTLKKKLADLKKELSNTYRIGDLLVYCYPESYFKDEILSGKINLDETDPDINTILIERDNNWGEIVQDNPIDYYVVEE